MKMMTSANAGMTSCPIIPPNPDGRLKSCRGTTCQLFVVEPETAGAQPHGRCSYAFAAIAVQSMGQEIATNVYNAIEQAGLALRNS